MKKKYRFALVGATVAVISCGFWGSCARIYSGGCIAENEGTLPVFREVSARVYATNCSFLGENPEKSIYLYEGRRFFGKKIISYFPNDEGFLPVISVKNDNIFVDINRGSVSFKENRYRNYKIFILNEMKLP